MQEGAQSVALLAEVGVPSRLLICSCLAPCAGVRDCSSGAVRGEVPSLVMGITNRVILKLLSSGLATDILMCSSQLSSAVLTSHWSSIYLKTFHQVPPGADSVYALERWNF